MTAFHQLDADSQQQLWTDIATAALKHYPLKGARVEWLAYTHNAVFRVMQGNTAYILRLHLPGSVKIPFLRSELKWLEALRHTRIVAPQPVRANNGDLFITTSHPAMPGDGIIPGTLFEHVEGESCAPDTITETHMRRVGELLGRLHTEGQVTSPDDFVRPRLDWEGLFGANSPYNPGDNASIFTLEQQPVFSQVADRVQEMMTDLGSSAEVFGMIHADLLAKNILFCGSEARPLDFEYCGWGYFLYDLSPLLWQLRHEARYPALRDALWAGYTSLRPQPHTYKDLLETFIAGRHLASCRWLASNLHNPVVRERAPGLIADRTEEMRHFLETGLLIRRSITL